MYKLLFVSLFSFLVACSSNEKKSESTTTENVAKTEKKYVCPMKCEGDKTYAIAGKCPVCKMDLQEVAIVETDSTDHAH